MEIYMAMVRKWYGHLGGRGGLNESGKQMFRKGCMDLALGMWMGLVADDEFGEVLVKFLEEQTITRIIAIRIGRTRWIIGGVELVDVAPSIG
jgi:hypothetical protein